MTEIQVGDVCLDLAQGRPVHVIETAGQTVSEWSDANDYNLLDNYGNSRLGADESDLVYDVVYCSSSKSEPSRSYSMPASRLLRIETEAADAGRPVRERIVRDTLEKVMLGAMQDKGDTTRGDIAQMATYAFDTSLISEASELADVEQMIQADD